MSPVHLCLLLALYAVFTGIVLYDAKGAFVVLLAILEVEDICRDYLIVAVHLMKSTDGLQSLVLAVHSSVYSAYCPFE